MNKKDTNEQYTVSFLDAIMAIEKGQTIDKLELTEQFEEDCYHSENLMRFTQGNTEHFVSEGRWNEYMQFIKELDSDVETFKKTGITNFWRRYETKQAEKNQLLSWIDPEKLSIAQQAVLSNKDKQHTRCFENLVLYKKALVPNDFSIFDQLDKELPNFKEVTAFYRGAFAMNRSRDNSKYQAPKPILLLGNPGIGKTHYAKRLATLLGTHYRFFDANSITAGWVLSGNNATWRGADAGLVFNELAKSETISPMILLDEIDKIKADTNQSPFSTFHQMFEKQNAATFFDEFIGLNFDASKIIYVLTANDAHNIAPSLLSRMTVFHVKNPDAEEMKPIIQTIYSDLLDGSKLFTKTLPDSEVEKLVRYSPREVAQLLSNNLHEAASILALKNNTKAKRLVVNAQTFNGKKKLGF
jgi:ATP-dependent Lon protease